VHARALKKADPSIHLIGIDADEFRINRAATDEIHLVPRSSSPDFIPTLRETVRRTRADLLLTNVTADIAVISAARDDIGCKTFLPEHSTIQICDDKARSNAAWQEAGVPVPRSMSVADHADLERAFRDLGPELWLRAVAGSGATGALPVSDMDTAIKWVELNNGWGKFMAAERLGAQTTSWESVWRNGELVVAQARKRLFWEFSRIAMSGVSGIAGAGEAVSDSEIDRIGMSAVKAVARRPHGVLGVDLAYDRNGQPKVTEINAGRFMSGGVCHFAAADFNIPAAAVRAALGEDPGFEPPLLNPVTPGLIFVSGLDREPVFTTYAEVEKLRAGMAERMRPMKQRSADVRRKAER
jgi:carbamoyl-phosphate synthase large subunit